MAQRYRHRLATLQAVVRHRSLSLSRPQQEQMEQLSRRSCLALTLAEPSAARSVQPCPNLQLVTTNLKNSTEEMMKLKMTLAVAALLTIGLSSAAAYADTVTFALTNPNGFVPHTGGSLTYDATVFAPAS